MSADVPISIVIPTHNEAKNLRRLLPQLQALDPNPQIIVSDADSNDRTRGVAAEFQVDIVNKAKGRGPQLNAGVTKSRGELLLFLHADSILLPESYAVLLQTMGDHPAIDGGAFRFSLGDIGGVWPKIYEYGVGLRTRFFNLPYGDQGFFLRRRFWDEGSCFADWPLMEDVEWWQRMTKRYSLYILPSPLITSARRFERRGYLPNALHNLWTLLRYQMGVSPEKLAKEYYR